jgi:hypothetical protein
VLVEAYVPSLVLVVQAENIEQNGTRPSAHKRRIEFRGE